MLRARKYRFALCFRVLSNQYVERSDCASVFKFNRENKRFERAKVSSRCFHWFPITLLESLRWAPTWRLHTKPYHFQWNISPNNSSTEYCTSPETWAPCLFITLLQYFNLLNQFWNHWLSLQSDCLSGVRFIHESHHFFALNRIFSSPKENGTVKQNNQSDFKVSLTYQ